MDIPSDMCAVVDKHSGRFWVYFVDTEGFISLYKGPDAGLKEDAVGNQEYDGPYVIKLNGEKVKTHPDAPKIAVVDYTPKSTGKWETRIYYLNERAELAELCWTADFNNSKWYRGALTSAQFKATPKTPLSAAVDDQWTKVYFQTSDGTELFVAWVVTGETGWTRRRAIAF